MTNLHLKTRYLLFLLSIILATGYVFFSFNPSLYTFYPKCGFHSLTGFDCPGCGSQRAIYDLLHGDIVAAISHNLLLVLCLPGFILYCFFKASALYTGREMPFNPLLYKSTPYIICFLVLLFWVVRNLPFSPFNYLAA